MLVILFLETFNCLFSCQKLWNVKYLGTDWGSTLAVASSSTSILLFLKIALAKHTSCRCPILRFEPPSEILAWSPCDISLTASFNSTWKYMRHYRWYLASIGSEQPLGRLPLDKICWPWTWPWSLNNMFSASSGMLLFVRLSVVSTAEPFLDFSLEICTKWAPKPYFL